MLVAARHHADAHRIFNAEDAEGRQKTQKRKTRNGFLLRLLNPFWFSFCVDSFESPALGNRLPTEIKIGRSKAAGDRTALGFGFALTTSLRDVGPRQARHHADAHRIFNAEDAEGRQKTQKRKTRNDFLLRLLNPFWFSFCVDSFESPALGNRLPTQEKSGRSRFPGSPGFPPARE
ncbi:hypothetical protein [Ramlibacter sp.]|uniref:hypothetical protein n=1 Tax=Ramlibacter sp. TaxID=1917967 RepID=UPI002FCCB1F7